MQFRPELAKKVLTGEKTVARWLVKQGEGLESHLGVGGKELKAVYNHQGVKWRVDQSYAIQPGRGPAIGRFRLLDIRRERVQDISEADAVAEGITVIIDGLRSARESFFRLWNSINTKPGQRVKDNPEVWVLVFEVVNPAQ